MQTDPHGGGADRPLVSERTVALAVAVVFLVLGLVLAYDNYRLGIGWERNGPQAGYFPFGLSVIMCICAVIGIADALAKGRSQEVFVTRHQAGRVLLVLVPTALFVVAMQLLGIYVASTALIAGFMLFVGRSRPWVALLVGVATSLVLFYIFEIQFQVPLPKGPLEDLLGY